jgi:hypothetical protein
MEFLHREDGTFRRVSGTALEEAKSFPEEGSIA